MRQLLPRPPLSVAAFVCVVAWMAAGSMNAPAKAFRTDEHICVLRADPRVRRSFVPPRSTRPTLTAAPGRRANATVGVTYTGFAAPARAAFQHAVDLWAAQLGSPAPIRIQAFFEPLGDDTLGFAVAPHQRDFPNALPGVFYPSALADRIAGFDLIPADPEVSAWFDATENWYFGTDGNTPAGQYDFVTAVLHELAHAFGFRGSGTIAGPGLGQVGIPSVGPRFPIIYDRFVVNGAGQSILDTALFPNPSAALAAQLTGDDLFFSGPRQRAANGNLPARLYAPAPYSSWTSYSHLHESAFGTGHPSSLMTPFLASGEAIHDPGPVTRGILEDLGWVFDSTPGCAYSAYVSRSAFAASGGSGLLTVKTGPGCPWTVSAAGGWITFGGAPSGVGPAVMTFAVAPLASRHSRQTSIVVAGQSVGILQSGVPCAFALSPAVLTFGAAGGPVPLQVTASAPDCPFVAGSISSWLTVNGATFGGHTGSTTLTITAAPAGAATRAGTLFVATTGVTVRQNGRATPVFDVNNDGAADLVAYDPVTGSRFFAFSDPRNLGFTSGATSAWSSGWTVSPGDFDGDGRGDLFFYNPATGRAIKARSTGPETFVYKEFAWQPGGQLTVADFSGDGSDDLFLYNPATGIGLRCISQPDGGFSFCNGTLWAPNWTIVPGDFNGDGRADLFVYNATADANHGRWFRILTDPPASIGLGNPPGGGIEVTPVEGEVVWRNDWTITPGDYDGDGRTDLFLYRPGGEWYRVFFTATGTRYETGLWSPGWTPSRGDFNGDGRDDLFVYNATTGRWFVVISEAGGTLTPYGGTANWSPGWQIHVTDINVDGVADLVLYNPVNGRWFQAVTQTPGVFAFANGTWPTGLQITATRPRPR